MQQNMMKNFKYIQHCIWYLFFFAIFPICQSFNYGEALSKSLLYFESQRSGRLPYNQRAAWRDHSGLTDGLEQGVSHFYPSMNVYIFSHYFQHVCFLR